MTTIVPNPIVPKSSMSIVEADVSTVNEPIKIDDSLPAEISGTNTVTRSDSHAISAKSKREFTSSAEHDSRCYDGKDDGKISFGEKVKAFKTGYENGKDKIINSTYSGIKYIASFFSGLFD